MDPSLLVQAEAARSLRGAALREVLLRVHPADRDPFVDGAFGFDLELPDLDLPPGAVPYLPAGVDEILALVRAVPLGAKDTFVDLGSGVGRVAILVHLLTGAQTRGIELQPHLVDRARETCRRLGLAAPDFVCADATAMPLQGTVFFLYAPFNGSMLDRAIDRLRAVPGPIVIAAVGLELHHVAWLKPRPATHPSLAIYDSAV